MYVPAAFRESRPEALRHLVALHPLALLVSQGAQELVATHLPMLLCAGDEPLLLRGHVARANPHWQDLERSARCMAVFRGEQGYVSPSWYPSKQQGGKVVPTWNYETVQAWGEARVVHDREWLRALVRELTREQELRRAHPWGIEDAPASYIDSMLEAIVGIEVVVSRFEGKVKMSQNRHARDRQGVASGLGDASDPHANSAMSRIVGEHGD